MSFLSNISSWLFSPAAAVESTSTASNSSEVASAPSPLAHRRAPTGDEWEHLSDGVSDEVEQKRHDERVAAVAQAVSAWAALAHRLRENSPPTSAATSPQTSTMSALTLGSAASAAAAASSSSDEDTDDRVPSADGDADAGAATLDSDYALALQLDETLNGAASASTASVDVRAPAPTLDEDTLLPGDVILTAAPNKVPLGARQMRHVAHVSETQRARMRAEEAVAKQVKMFAEHRLRAANAEHYKPLLAERRIERMLTKIVRNGDTRSRSAWTHQNAARKLKADTVTVE